jgi:hypothetical protein
MGISDTRAGVLLCGVSVREAKGALLSQLIAFTRRVMLQPNNLLLAVAILAIAYAWHRTGFQTPKFFGLSTHVTRRIVVASGWLLVVGSVGKSAAAGFLGDGRVQIAKSGQMYASRAREPMLFWGEIVGEILVVGGIGTVLIVLGRIERPRVQRA